jgi:hypothetical protein
MIAQGKYISYNMNHKFCRESAGVQVSVGIGDSSI